MVSREVAASSWTRPAIRSAANRIACHANGLLQKDERFVLSVQDSGPGLPESDQRRLGERFFRTPGNVESGSGLGWSIVKRIAQAHGFTLQVDTSAEMGGLAVRLIGKTQANGKGE